MDVTPGPPTSHLLSPFPWTDGHPAWQEWADELAQLLSFADTQGRLRDFAAKKCKHCGEFFDPALRQKRMPQAWNPGVAAVLSLVIPGAGQMYKGQIGPGIWWLIGTVAGYCAFVVPGLILHIVCIYKAYSDDPVKANISKRR